MIEVIVAIAVLGVGIAGVLALISRTISAGTAAGDRMIAANLAQEGIEVVRGLRDANYIQGNAYDKGFSAGTNCVNFDSTSLDAGCTQGITLNWDGSHYTHAPGASSKFFRNLDMATTTDSDGEIFWRIQSTMSWDNSDLTAEDHLYDWR